MGKKKKGSHKGRDKEKYKSDLIKFKEQLSVYGLRIIEVEGDGNCMFRSIAVQLFGMNGVTSHMDIRRRAVQFMVTNREDFEPFLEDDEKWDDYIARMSKDGTWGGHLELTAISRAFEIDITIHHLGQPRFELRTGYGGKPRKVEYHISYHDGDHYNALRGPGESEFDPAKSLRLDYTPPKTTGGNTGAAAASASSGTSVMRFQDETESLKGRSELIKVITASTGCFNINHIESLLDACENDVETCIEILLNEKRIGEDWESEEYTTKENDMSQSAKVNEAKENGKSKKDSPKESQKKVTTKEKKEAKKNEKAAIRKKQAEEAKKEEAKKAAKGKDGKKGNDDSDSEKAKVAEPNKTEPLVDLVGALQI